MEETATIMEQLFELPEIQNFDSNAFLKKRIQRANEVEGSLTGLNCPKCRNKGIIYMLDDNGYEFVTECDCMKQRKALARIERSGLKDALQRMTFENYQVRNSWQTTVKNSATEFVENPSQCFYIGGNTGSGKTHICTAICGELIKQGYEVRYLLWRDLLHRLESNRFNEERYSHIMDEIRNVDVVYIDDFLKMDEKSSSALEYAFEIVNQRYISRKITIISSEWYLDEILTLGKATGGRIHEMCGNPMFELKLTREESKNQRYAMGT